MTSRYLAPVPLHGDNDVSAFECRSREQTDWLRRHARQSVATGTTRVFVVTEIDSPTVVAYYGWCMAQLDVGSAPARLRKGAGRYPQPIALLARLGVDIRREGRGLGAALLQEVFATAGLGVPELALLATFPLIVWGRDELRRAVERRRAA